jgi:hypothetical protein
VGVATLSTPVGLPLVIGGGAALAGGSLITGIAALICPDSSQSNCSDDGGNVAAAFEGIGLLVAIVGLIVLDEDHSTYLKFEPLDEKGAAALGLTAEERADFNLYNDELNAVSQQIGVELKALGKADLNQSQALWNKYRSLLPTDATFTAAAKVSAHWLRPVVERAK